MGPLVTAGLTSLIVAALGVGDAGDRPLPGKNIVPISIENLTAHSDNDSLGQYYSLLYQLPPTLQGSWIERAFLELYARVETKSRNGFLDGTPLLEVYALLSPFEGPVDLSELDLATRASRPVATGQARRVVIDVTHIIRAHITGHLENHGLLIGNMTGARDGSFSVLVGQLPANSVAQLRIYSDVSPTSDN